MYAHMCMYVYILCIYIYMHICIYIYMYTCIYIYTYMKLSAAILCVPRNLKQCIGAIFERPCILRASYVNMCIIYVYIVRNNSVPAKIQESV